MDPVKPKHQIAKHTRTWQLFELYFLDQPNAAYPIFLKGLTKGQAINLAVGLNRCHVQHGKEQGMPDDALLYSAKPREDSDSGENLWLVEISTNYTRTGELKPSQRGRRAGSQAWLEAQIQRGKAELAQQPATQQKAEQASGSPEPELDAQDQFLAKYLGGQK